MNIEEIDKWLDNEYGCSYTKLEELHNYWFEKSTDQKLEIERLNNIINNIDKKCKYLLENEKVIINEKIYYKQKCDDIITNFIYEELKGDGSND